MGVLGAIFLAWSVSAWCADKEQPLQIVATPNPNVFPLLIALEENPDLPVHLIPVPDGNGIDDAFKKGADGVLAMTYASAQEAVSGKVPDLELQGVYFWRGFFEITIPDVHSLAELRGKGLIVSGPTSGPNGGAPDRFFQAALWRAGLFPEDFNVCYLSIKKGVDLLESGKPMNSEKVCNGTDSAAGILLVEPASSGLLMKSSFSLFSDQKLHRGIDMQKLFTGYKSWNADELPHGGFAIRRSALANPVKKAQMEAFIKAYRAAIDRINAADDLFSRLRISWIISRGMKKYYGQYEINPSILAISKSMGNGEMRFRNDRPVSKMRADLDKFLKEVLSVQTIPPAFYSNE
jgi:hypothetical protein